jgi:hypothetical protein
MPVGCVHQFIVVKRNAVLKALDKAVAENDHERQKVARLMLTRLHSDDYLIAIEDMGGTDYDIENLKHLGLEAHDGNEWSDYYAPHLAKLPASWLMNAPIRELRPDGTHGPVIWQGFRHILDSTTYVAVWEDEDYPAKQREPFPSTAQMAW